MTNPDTGAVELVRELCVLPVAGHTLWIPNVATDIINNFGDVKFAELSNGTAVLAGVGYSRSNPEDKYEFFFKLNGLEGEIDNNAWYYYHGMTGEIRSAGESDYLKVNTYRRGGAFQVGYGANKKNGAYGAAGWFSYWGNKEGNGDINVKLVSCDKEPPQGPSKPEWVDYEVLAANGSACPGGDVSVSGSANTDRIDLEMPMINIETDRFASRHVPSNCCC